MRFTLVLSLFLLLVLGGSCVIRESPTTEKATSTQPASGPSPAVAAKQGWQQEWDKLVKAAQEEGTLVITTSMPTDARTALSDFIKGKYGLKIEFIVGRAGERVEKLMTERRAGLYTTDVYLSGAATAIRVLKPAGGLERLDPVLFLPEVLDRNAWWGGDLLWVDPEHYMAAFQAIVKQNIVVNKDIVKPEEIKSWRDLLQFKFKGKIAMDDPTTSGSGNATFSALAMGIMDLNYLRELAKQEPAFTRDRRLMAEWVARGKYPVGIAMDDATMTEFKKAGAAFEFVTPAEGTYLTASSGAIALINRPPHPNAAKFFTNWMLTREGTTVYSKAAGGQSGRVDVAIDHLDPLELRQPGVKYVNQMNEETEYKKAEYMKVAQEVFGHLIK